MVTHLEPDILECKVKWALGSITTNKVSGGDGIPAELFKILKEDAVKVLHLICQQIWKMLQWPHDWKSSNLKELLHEVLSINSFQIFCKNILHLPTST